MYYIYVENNLRRHSHTLCVCWCTVGGTGMVAAPTIPPAPPLEEEAAEEAEAEAASSLELAPAAPPRRPRVPLGGMMM